MNLATFQPEKASAAEKREAQSALAAAGLYHAAIDGIFGPQSKAALNAWKERQTGPMPPLAPDYGLVDARSEAAIATLLPPVRPLARALVNKAALSGITIKVTSGTRTYAEQDALYAKHDGTTRARGGYSNHNFGLAFDVTIFDGAKPVWESPGYARVGAMGKALGLTWGGDWKSIVDEPHFELRPAWAANMSEGAMLAEFRARKARGTELLT